MGGGAQEAPGGVQRTHLGRLEGRGRLALGCKLSKASISTLLRNPSQNMYNNQTKPEPVATVPLQLTYSTLFPTSALTLLPKPSYL